MNDLYLEACKREQTQRNETFKLWRMIREAIAKLDADDPIAAKAILVASLSGGL